MGVEGDKQKGARCRGVDLGHCCGLFVLLSEWPGEHLCVHVSASFHGQVCTGRLERWICVSEGRCFVVCLLLSCRPRRLCQFIRPPMTGEDAPSSETALGLSNVKFYFLNLLGEIWYHSAMIQHFFNYEACGVFFLTLNHSISFSVSSL